MELSSDGPASPVKDCESFDFPKANRMSFVRKPNDLTGCGSGGCPLNTERVTYLQKVGWRAEIVLNVMPPAELWSYGTHHATRSSARKEAHRWKAIHCSNCKSFQNQVLVTVPTETGRVLHPESQTQAWWLPVRHEKACKIVTGGPSGVVNQLLLTGVFDR